MNTEVTLNLNGREVSITTAAERSLLEVLREEIGLTGAKYGCGEGRCGACTVLLDGEPVRSCLMPIEQIAGSKVTTIEGLSRNGSLHPIQEAFLAEGAIQCGFCTPGMVLAAVALLKKSPRPSEKQIVAGMNGHLCRCCGYPKIVKAIQSVAMREEKGS